MVLPTLTYCSNIHLKRDKCQQNQLTSFHRRAKSIIKANSRYTPKVKSVRAVNSIKACETVRNCIDGNVCSNFRNYFVKIKHKHTNEKQQSSVESAENKT